MNGIMMQRRRLMVAPSVPVSLSGGRVNFAAAGMQPVAPVVTLKSIQSGSGTQSPENKWQLGQTGLTIERAGKNLAHLNRWEYPAQPTNPTVAQDLPAGVQITASCLVKSVTGGTVAVGIRYTVNGSTTSSIGNAVSSSGTSSVTVKAPVGATAVSAYISRATAVTSCSVDEIMVRLTGSGYEPFRGRQTVRVDFGREVGAGTFDAGTGLLTVTHGIYDASNATIGGSVSSATFEPSPAMASGSWYNDADTHCNVLPKINSIRYKGVSFVNQKVRLYNLKDTYPSLTTLAAIQAWVAEVGLKVAYPLAEPLTIQLAPAAVMAMPGYNNIWMDGTISGTYSRSMDVTYKRHAWEV